METSSLPTDNLYKFIALAGLALLLLLTVYPTKKIYELQLQIVREGTELSILDINEKNWTTDFERLKSQKNPPRAEVLRLRDRSREMEINAVKLRGKNDEIKAVLGELKKYQWAMYLGSFVGLTMMVFGFGLWYSRVQKYLDKQLRDGSTSAPGDS